MSNQSTKYDSSSQIWLLGEAGLFKDEQVAVRLGESVYVGRSRVCTLSVVRTKISRKMGRGALEDHPSYRKISRKHFRVTLLSEELVEVEDLSTNGTAINGHRVDRMQLSINRDEDRLGTIEFGAGEIVAICGRPVNDVPSGLTKIGDNEGATNVPSEDGAVSGELKR
jgi:pSer/pThr/pTyr-binding forkhead associated (FHA) protein